MNNNDEVKKIEEYMKQSIEEYMNNPKQELSEIDIEFNKYCELYKERFNKNAYVAEPSGTKEKTINAIKICLEKKEDLLDEILYPNFSEDMENDVFY